MQVVIEKDPIAFLNKYEAWLRQKTSENDLPLRILYGCKNGKYKEGIFFAVLENNKPVLLAMRTPPKNLVLSEDGSKDALEFLAKFLVKEGIEIPGAIGSVQNAKEFMGIYAGLKGKNFETEYGLHVYSINKTIEPKPVDGELVFATQDDLEILAKYKHDFNMEALPEREWVTFEETREKTLRYINEKNAAIWKVNGNNVAMIMFSDLDGIAHIVNVYTLPNFRGKGYAATMTAQVSQMLLDRGRDACCLCADMANPTSNGVYQRIGYKHVTDSIVYVLKD